jgi:hypothetical protein
VGRVRRLAAAVGVAPAVLLALVVIVVLWLFRRSSVRASTEQAIMAATATGDPALEQWRPYLAAAVAREFEGEDAIAVTKALLAITNNELPAGAHRRDMVIVGDRQFDGGPSVGPWQVYRSTAIDLGLWTPPEDVTDDDGQRAAYEELAQDPEWCARAAVEVFAAKLQIAGGDVADAIRRYNGGGPAAQAYKARAVAWLAAKGWGEVVS